MKDGFALDDSLLENVIGGVDLSLGWPQGTPPAPPQGNGKPGNLEITGFVNGYGGNTAAVNNSLYVQTPETSWNMPEIGTQNEGFNTACGSTRPGTEGINFQTIGVTHF